MNRILYLLIGVGVAAMAALAFVQRQDFGKIGAGDVLAVVAMGAVAAAAACFLIYSRLGQKWRLRLDQKTMDEDDRIRMNARTKGEVRPPMGP